MKYQFAPKELHEIQEEINSILINRPLFEAGVKSFPDKFPHLPQKSRKDIIEHIAMEFIILKYVKD